MNNKADYAPIRWGYKKTREVARRMDGVYPCASRWDIFKPSNDSIPWRAYIASPTFPPRIPGCLQGHRYQDCKGALPQWYDRWYSHGSV